MVTVVKEYYILLNAETKEIFGVFDTLEECLTWRSASSFEATQLLISRVKRLDTGVFKIQQIRWTVS